MTQSIGPSFLSELVAAGVSGDGGVVGWTADGTLIFTSDATDAAKAKAQGVLKAHDPVKAGPAAPLSASGDDVIGALSAADAAKADVRDIVRLAARSVVTTANAKLVRVAKAVGRAPEDLLKAAQG